MAELCLTELIMKKKLRRDLKFELYLFQSSARESPFVPFYSELAHLLTSQIFPVEATLDQEHLKTQVSSKKKIKKKVSTFEISSSND